MAAMRELSDVGDSYDSLLADLRAAIQDARREWSASLLCAYPDRDAIGDVANEVCTTLEAAGVEVNVIYANRQLTIASAPERKPPTSVEADQSLCVLTVGYGRPLALADALDGFVGADHGMHERGLRSWASVPILIQGEAAGTVCALGTSPRQWAVEDEAILACAAQRIARSVEAWLEEN